ncbi:DUF3817 domain-containing protein [Nonomuraea thailandensis]
MGERVGIVGLGGLGMPGSVPAVLALMERGDLTSTPPRPASRRSTRPSGGSNAARRPDASARPWGRHHGPLQLVEYARYRAKGWIVLRWFRVLAVAEACSWAGLLVGMFFKYVTETGELGVKIFGPIHGALFVLYAAGVLLSAREAGWSRGAVVLGLACAVPPFTSLWFERRMAARTAAGQLA